MVGDAICNGYRPRVLILLDQRGYADSFPPNLLVRTHILPGDDVSSIPPGSELIRLFTDDPCPDPARRLAQSDSFSSTLALSTTDPKE